MIDLAAARYLTSPRGRADLERLRVPQPSSLAAAEEARTVAGPRFGPALALTRELRRRARDKFEHADSMFFTGEALEQASAAIIARHRSTRFAHLASVVDAGCSIGGDLIELARNVGAIGVEMDPVRAVFAAANVSACTGDEAGRIVVADVRRLLPPADGLFCDPSRRHAGTRRVADLEQISPPFSWVVEQLARFDSIGAKLSPLLSRDVLQTPCELEHVSVRGECREAIAWLGQLKTAERRATALPSGETFCSDAPPPRPRVGDVRTYLFDPDPALIQSGLLAEFAAKRQLDWIDASVPYLTGDVPIDSSLVRAYRVLEQHPFQLKALRKRLRELHVGRVEIKKRGFAITPEEIRGRLDLRGDQDLTIILTRIGNKRVTLLSEALRDTPR